MRVKISQARKNRVAEKLDLILEKAGMSTTEFSEHLGVPGPTVSNWINGRHIPNRDHTMMISGATGLSAQAVCDFEMEMEAIFTEHEVAQLRREIKRVTATLDRAIMKVRKAG